MVVYNFTGIDHLKSRNQKMAERIPFDSEDINAKKTSLIWAHSSELNRVYFEVWGYAQLVLGVITVLTALLKRQGLLIPVALCLALGIVCYSQFWLNPQIVKLGRQLDFTPRIPPPPQVEEFNKLHSLSFNGDLVRFLAVSFATLLALKPGLIGAKTRLASSSETE